MSVEFSIEVKTTPRSKWSEYGGEKSEALARAAIAALTKNYEHVSRWRFRIVKVTRQVLR